MQAQDQDEIRHPQDNNWEAAFADILPKGWKVIGIRNIPAPSEWKRTRGKDGVKIAMKNAGVTIQHEMVGPYHPFLVVCVVPRDWEGHGNYGQKLEVGKYTPPDRRLMAVQDYPAQYLGQNRHYHFFSSTVGHGVWSKAEDDIVRYFGLTIEKSAPTSSSTTR